MLCAEQKRQIQLMSTTLQCSLTSPCIEKVELTLLKEKEVS
jgi:hypothetical protein